MSKRAMRRKPAVEIGDIYAVPLDPLARRYGYVRMYHEPSVAIMGVISEMRLLDLEEVAEYPIIMEVSASRTAIDKGIWPKIGNLPFGSDEGAWPKPHKQVSRIRPDVRFVIYRGDIISEAEFGAYDDLPVWKRLSDEGLVNEINSHPELFAIFS
ncbi:immunity 26/phosphotriesterase HocA family protein [Serratia nevei]|uniref:Imm26 family immunity protein n=1 Tax=Serratia nevei TaxID=2703794 RepID=UPI00209CCE05|nr:Imm26 family immunity protein [Serratia nevei]MCP1107745.1 immunity 26/phosphotriesterase HocA family protein [Serratia nevei]